MICFRYIAVNTLHKGTTRVIIIIIIHGTEVHALWRPEKAEKCSLPSHYGALACKWRATEIVQYLRLSRLCRYEGKLQLCGWTRHSLIRAIWHKGFPGNTDRVKGITDFFHRSSSCKPPHHTPSIPEQVTALVRCAICSRWLSSSTKLRK